MKRLDSYLTNIRLPWDCCRGTRSRGHNTAIYAPIGAVALSKLSQVDGKWTIMRLWVKNFGEQISCLHWDDSIQHLYVGLCSGKVVVLQVMGGDYHCYRTLAEMSCAKSPITGLTNNRKTMTMVYHPDSLSVVDKLTGKCLDRQVSTGELTSMYKIPDRHLFAITDATGFIHVYANIGAPLEHVMTHRFQNKQ